MAADHLARKSRAAGRRAGRRGRSRSSPSAPAPVSLAGAPGPARRESGIRCTHPTARWITEPSLGGEPSRADDRAKSRRPLRRRRGHRRADPAIGTPGAATTGACARPGSNAARPAIIGRGAHQRDREPGCEAGLSLDHGVSRPESTPPPPGNIRRSGKPLHEHPGPMPGDSNSFLTVVAGRVHAVPRAGREVGGMGGSERAGETGGPDIVTRSRLPVPAA